MSKLVFIRGSSGTFERDGIKGELFLIDDEDEWIVRESQWRLLNGLAITRSNRKSAKGNPKAVFLHELIVSINTAIPEGKIVKWANGNKKDLRKSNLIFKDKHDNIQYKRNVEDTIANIEEDYNALWLSEEDKVRAISGEKGEKGEK